MKSMIDSFSFHRMIDVSIDDFRTGDMNYVDLKFKNEREQEFEITLFCDCRVDVVSMLEGLREQITNTLQEIDEDA